MLMMFDVNEMFNEAMARGQVHTHAHMHTDMHTHVHTHKHAHTHTQTHTHTHTHTQIKQSMHIQMWLIIDFHKHTHTHTHTDTYARTRTRTRTRTRAQTDIHLNPHLYWKLADTLLHKHTRPWRQGCIGLNQSWQQPHPRPLRPFPWRRLLLTILPLVFVSSPVSLSTVEGSVAAVRADVFSDRAPVLRPPFCAWSRRAPRPLDVHLSLALKPTSIGGARSHAHRIGEARAGDTTRGVIE